MTSQIVKLLKLGQFWFLVRITKQTRNNREWKNDIDLILNLFRGSSLLISYSKLLYCSHYYAMFRLKFFWKSGFSNDVPNFARTTKQNSIYQDHPRLGFDAFSRTKYSNSDSWVKLTQKYIHCVANVYAVLPFYNVKCLCSGGREWGREESHSH